ncbi:MAG: HAD family hydrolase [Acidobacteria bacterium]|nr:MAG: HAD family hydrolase [Acidobacteriota bacterium]
MPRADTLRAMGALRAAVLFDVDGTLIDARGAGRRALARAASVAFAVPERAAGEALAAIDFRGATDRGITLALATALGRRPGERFPELLEAYVRFLEEEMRAAERRLLPGVGALLAQLEARRQISVGLLTGNFRRAARIKLAPFGLDHLADRPGGFGEDGLDRRDIARAAVRRIGALGIPPRRVLVVGDTPRDVRAARAAGARAVAVASGWTPRDELEGCGAEIVLTDLSEPHSLLGLVDGMNSQS